MPRMTFTNVLGSAVAIGNADGYGKSFTIPPAGLVVDLTGAQLESIGPQLELAKSKNWISWVKTENPAVTDELEVLANVPRALLMTVGPIAAKSVTAIHAAVAGNAAANLFPGPITNPASPRNATAVAAAAYDGGALTLVGTDQFDRAQTEVITPVAGSTVLGVKIWKTITSITKAAVGAAAAAVSVGTGDKIGVTFNISAAPALLYVGTTIEAVTLDATVDGFTPTTVPAATTYTLLANVAT